MGDHISMSISVDSPPDETLNRGPLALLLQRQYEFPSEIDIVQFQFSFDFVNQPNFFLFVKEFKLLWYLEFLIIYFPKYA